MTARNGLRWMNIQAYIYINDLSEITTVNTLQQYCGIRSEPCSRLLWQSFTCCKVFRNFTGESFEGKRNQRRRWLNTIYTFIQSTVATSSMNTSRRRRHAATRSRVTASTARHVEQQSDHWRPCRRRPEIIQLWFTNTTSASRCSIAPQRRWRRHCEASQTTGHRIRLRPCSSPRLWTKGNGRDATGAAAVVGACWRRTEPTKAQIFGVDRNRVRGVCLVSVAPILSPTRYTCGWWTVTLFFDVTQRASYYSRQMTALCWRVNEQ